MKEKEDVVATFDVVPKKNCNKCGGRGYTGWYTDAARKGRKVFCEKCVIPVVKDRLRGIKDVVGTVNVVINLTEEKHGQHDAVANSAETESTQKSDATGSCGDASKLGARIGG